MNRQGRIVFGGLTILGALWGVSAPAAEADSAARRVVKDGVAVEFSLSPAGDPDKRLDAATVNADVMVRLAITDAATGAPLSGLNPAAWLDARKAGAGNPPCGEKIRGFLQASLAYRPDIDLNAWYLLVLNRLASITVIDPLLQFGRMKVVTMIVLDGAGQDWALGRGERQLYVSVPSREHVAVIDTATWKTTHRLAGGPHLSRVAVQPDGRYVWVGNDRAGPDWPSGVVVIDAAANAVKARVATGSGHHEIAFSDDDRFAYVSNGGDGTVSVVDIAALAKVGDVAVGGEPAAMAYSRLAKAFYVADAAQGVVSVIDGASQRVLARIRLHPGVRALRVSDDGRWLFAANPARDEVHVIDAAANRVAHALTIEGGPDYIALTPTFAYVRTARSGTMTQIALAGLDREGQLATRQIPAGQAAPDRAQTPGTSTVIAPIPSGNGVLIANPADKQVYYYMEGMNAPMGSFNNASREMNGALAVSRAVRETAPGEYTALTRVPAAAEYDLAVLLDSPRLSHCFTLAAKADPRLAASGPQRYRLEYAEAERTHAVGEKAPVRFTVTDAATGRPVSDAADIEVTVLFAGDGSQRHLSAKVLGEGGYEVTVPLAAEGVYYLFVKSTSLRVRSNDLPGTSLRAIDPKAGGKG